MPVTRPGGVNPIAPPIGGGSNLLSNIRSNNFYHSTLFPHLSGGTPQQAAAFRSTSPMSRTTFNAAPAAQRERGFQEPSKAFNATPATSRPVSSPANVPKVGFSPSGFNAAVKKVGVDSFKANVAEGEGSFGNSAEGVTKAMGYEPTYNMHEGWN